ncbi:MAG: nucleotidyl transferase AbiEii/AbiGii toxin family protein [Bacteroidota bacterium]|nr:nucleotidyl transferase AbiEii/AbiGii toxin family protein [Bacteroidota bacterium]
MLQKQTVSPGTLELLISLMKDEELWEFFLVGGTALSLQIGHRVSIDLDLFSINPFDENLLLAYLESTCKFQLDYQSKNTLKGQINGVKVDFITHSYPLVYPKYSWKNIKKRLGQMAAHPKKIFPGIE